MTAGTENSAEEIVPSLQPAATGPRAWAVRATTLGGVVRRHPRLLAYALPSALAGGVVASWFRPGHFFAAGDIAPFERLASIRELWSIWSYQLTSAGGPSYGMTRLPEFAVSVVAARLGVGPEIAQQAFFALVAAGLVASTTYFAFAFTRRATVAAVVGLLGFFNIFVLQHLPNTLTLWAIMQMGLLGGLVFRARPGGPEARPPRPFVLALVTLLSCYVAVNPPLLAITVVWTASCVVASGLLWGRPALAGATRLVGRAAPWAAVLNLWWAVPFVMTMVSERSKFAAETSVAAWSWTHARNSLANLVSLSAHWGWEIADFYPYAARLDEAPLGLLKFALPVLAGSALLLARPARRQVVALVAMAAAVVLLAKGLHPPLAQLNRVLYERAPVMYLFREPNGKFTTMLVLILVALSALALSGALDRGRSLVRTAPAALLAAAALAYPVPLWTGDVVKDRTGDFPSAHVALPDEWRQVAEHLNRPGRAGKVLVLPLDDFYQMPTTWGFYGADVIPRYLLRRPTIQPLSEGYFGDVPAFRGLVDRTERALIAGDVGQVPQLLDALGVSDVVLRKDIDLAFPGRRLLDPDRLRLALDRTPGMLRQASTGVADVYARTNDRGAIHLAASTVGVGDARDTAAAVAGARARVVTRPAELTSSSMVRVLEAPERAVRLPGPGTYSVSRQLVSGVAVRVTPVGDPPVALEVVDDAPVEVDGRSVAELPPFRVGLPESGQWAAMAGGRLLSLEGGVDRAVVKPGDTVDVFDTATAITEPASFSAVGDCHAWDDRTPEEVGIRAVPLAEEAPAIRLEARGHAACSRLVLPAPPASGRYVHRLRLEHRTVSGRPARICVYHRDRGCEPLAPLPASGDWATYDVVFAGEPGAPVPELFVYADGDSADGATTVTEYRRVVPSTHPVHRQRWVPTVGPASVAVEARRAVVRIRTPPAEPAGDLSEAKDCHAVDRRPLDAVGIEARPIAGSPPAVRLQAREHIGCVTLPVRGPGPEARYRVSFEHRTLSGRPARACLFQTGLGRCAPLRDLASAREWQRFDQVVVPEAGARSLQLFLYADGDGGRTTTAEFRDVAVDVVAPFDVVAVPEDDEAPRVPPLTWRRTGGASYTIEVPASASPRTVILTESYSPYWKAQPEPEIEFEHFAANGYANAWRLPPGSAVVLRVSYGPNRAFLPLVGMSAGALAFGLRQTFRPAAARLRSAAGRVRQRQRRTRRASSR